MFKSSEVFSYMNDEAIKSDDGKEVQNDTAFLQRNGRSKVNDSDNLGKLDDITPIITDVSNDEYLNEFSEETDELPELCKCDKIKKSSHVEKTSTSDIVSEETFLDENHQHLSNVTGNNKTNEQFMESQEDLKKQILNIQNQIRKLSNLPSIIQTAISDIANQVSELIPAIQENVTTSTEIHDFNLSENVNNQKIDVQELHLENSSTEDNITMPDAIEAGFQAPNVEECEHPLDEKDDSIEQDRQANVKTRNKYHVKKSHRNNFNIYFNIRGVHVVRILSTIKTISILNKRYKMLC